MLQIIEKNGNGCEEKKRSFKTKKTELLNSKRFNTIKQKIFLKKKFENENPVYMSTSKQSNLYNAVSD